MNFKKSLLALAAILTLGLSAHAIAGGNELAYFKLQELPILATTAVDTAADYMPVYDASAGKVVRTLVNSSLTGAKVVDVTASTLSVTPTAHSGKVITLTRAAGITTTLPAATGTGNLYRFFITTTVTSNTTVIKVANSTDIMAGTAFQAADAGSTSNAWETGATDDTITFNGTTTGGIKGDYVELLDVAAGIWFVRVTGSATGTEATPFSSTV